MKKNLYILIAFAVIGLSTSYCSAEESIFNKIETSLLRYSKSDNQCHDTKKDITPFSQSDEIINISFIRYSLGDLPTKKRTEENKFIAYIYKPTEPKKDISQFLSYWNTIQMIM